VTNDLGSIAYQKAQYRRASLLWQQALPQYRGIYGDDHPEVASILNNLGRVALVDRRFKDAMHDDLIFPLNSLGLAHMGLARYRKADSAFGEALAIARRHDHWMLGVVLTSLADLRVRESEFASASALVAEARKELKEAFPANTRVDEGWRFKMLESVQGAVLDGLGRHAEAGPLLTGAVQPLTDRFAESSLFAVDAMQRALRHRELTGDEAAASALRQRLERALGASAVRG
jgi:tetratricopeptide (TPR) repeat protein